MPLISFEDRQYQLTDGETVLEGLQRHGVYIRSSCRSGICQSCIMRSVERKPPVEAQAGLKESLQESNHFLACQCRPTGDMKITHAGADVLPWVDSVVLDKEILNRRIVRLTLSCPDKFSFNAGQFINLLQKDLIRSYSIAGPPDPSHKLELHVYQVDKGKMSNWIHNELQPGDEIFIQGPYGDCVYRPALSSQPLLLIGTGTGLAPLRGVLLTALKHNHAAPIHLYHGSRTPEGVYLSEEMRTLEALHPCFAYTPCLSGGEVPDGYAAGRATDVALARHPQLQGWGIYVCGNAEMVRSTKKMAYLAGAALKDIHSDPFEYSHTRSAQV